MSSNYLFNEVTGQSDYERQSWRDSYNGGRSAGDITGNVNRELDRERDAFQGATWSGSSSEYSALELAQRMGGAGQAVAATGTGASKSSGPGNEVVTQGPVTPGRPAGGAGAGSRLVLEAPDRSVLVPKDGPLKRIGIGGQQESLGAISDIGWMRTATGWRPVPSSDVKERIEDNFFMETDWFFRNYIGPMFFGGGNEVGPDFLDPKYSHYVAPYNEWREGSQPRAGKDGQWFSTGGGF